MRCSFLLCALLLAAVSLSPSYAGLSIRGTRVVYDEARGEANVRIQYSTGRAPILMQAWLDNDDPDLKPGEHDLPFLITPAVTRMDPGDVQMLRILRMRDGLPQDRETLLYLNILEIPPSAAEAMDAGQNYLQFSMQARLKFFYRPKGLQPTVEEAVNLLRFALEEAGEGERISLRIHNPTPYHIVLSALALHAPADGDGDVESPVLASFDMNTALGPTLEPFSQASVPLATAAGADLRALAMQPAAALQVHYTVINDQGGHNPKQRALDDVL